MRKSYVLWKRLLPGRVGSSPSTVGGVVYVPINDNEVMAVRLRTGSVKWTWKTTTTSDFGSVSAPTTDGKGVYFSADGGTKVWGLNAATGAQRWTVALDSGNGSATDGLTVSLLAGRVYAGNVAGMVYSINAATGAIVWQADVGVAVWRSVIATPQAILTLPDEWSNGYAVEDQITALSPADGHVLWNYVVPDGIVSTGLATANGVVYLGWADMDETVSSLDAVDLTTGARLARIALPAPVSSDPTAYPPRPPAISNGRVYVPRFHELIALAL